MPLYEYRCTECAATLEAIQAFSAPPLVECPECGRDALKKLLSAPAFQFKGSGWYVNDYARKKNAGGNGKEASPNGGGSNADASAQASSGSKAKAGDPTPSGSKAATARSGSAAS